MLYSPDVDQSSTTSISFFDANNVQLLTSFVPSATVASGGLSFLGVSFTEGSVISRVRITNGNTAIGPGVVESAAAGRDLVVMDDFIYAEPRIASIPLPSTLWLCVVALVMLAWRSRAGQAARG